MFRQDDEHDDSDGGVDDSDAGEPEPVLEAVAEEMDLSSLSLSEAGAAAANIIYLLTI